MGLQTANMENIVKAMDDFVKNLKDSCNLNYNVRFRKGNLEIIYPDHHPKVFLIRNIVTGTIFSPSNDLEYLIDIVQEITEE